MELGDACFMNLSPESKLGLVGTGEKDDEYLQKVIVHIRKLELETISVAGATT
jgi:hypothetical protein